MLSRNGLADLATASLFLTVGVVAAHAQPMKQHPLPTRAEMAIPETVAKTAATSSAANHAKRDRCKTLGYLLDGSVYPFGPGDDDPRTDGWITRWVQLECERVMGVNHWTGFRQKYQP